MLFHAASNIEAGTVISGPKSYDLQVVGLSILFLVRALTLIRMSVKKEVIHIMYRNLKSFGVNVKAPF